MVDRNSINNRACSRRPLLTDVKLDPELTRISMQFLKDIEEIRTCKKCGSYLDVMKFFYCSNSDCPDSF